MRKRVFAFVAILGAAWSAGEAALGSDFDVVINEVHYNPLSNLEDDEYIELFNRGPTSVDLSGWRFVEGISFVFAPGTRIDAKEFLVVSPDAARALTRYGLTHAAGNYSGHLDNDGEIVTLVNSQGAIMSRVHYGDGDLWPSRPDGLGASLELLDPHAVPDLPRKWSSSLYLDGTPGEANSRAALGSAAPKIVVGAQELWRYWKSSTEPSNPLLDWTTTGFNDSAWATGPGGFGYGTQPFETELADMQGSYTGLYIRSKFTLTAAELSAIQSGRKSLVLTVRYDDGFVAYANGSEIGRANAANAGSPPLHGATADGSLTGQAFVTLEPATAGLVAGQNAVAIHGLNSGTASADFLLEAELRLNEAPVSARDIAPDVVINEVKPTEGASAGFIELYNRSAETLGLAGYQIIDSQGSAFSIPGGTNLPPHGWVAFSAAELDFEPALANASYALVIQDSPSGRRELVDGLHPRAPPAGTVGLSFARVPDGGDDLYLTATPTQEAANSIALNQNVVINEVMYHPPFVAPGGGCTVDCSDALQWIEVINRGAANVDLAGWGLSKAVSFSLPAAPALTVPPGGFLIFASSKTAFLGAHPGFNPALVVGDWTKDLSHSTDTINLNDRLGNRVDHVKYGDGKPQNDEEPMDDVDDQTFLGSDWPSGSDGTGRSLELIHPSLDNRDGRAWSAGPLGGTPGAANGSFATVPFAVIGDVSHAPLVPRPVDPVTVRCRVSATQGIAAVEALWHREGAAGSGTVALKDDGVNPDAKAGDGVFTGTIAAQPDRAIIGFQLRARLADGKITTIPTPPAVPPYAGFTGPYFLYQVLAAQPPATPSEDYFVVMAPADLNELTQRPEISNELLPCTFIHRRGDGSGTIRYLAGIRYRGEQTRNDDRKGYRIEFPPELEFEGMDRLNLVAASIDREILVSDLFRRAGMPGPEEWTVNLTFQGVLDPLYAAKEHIDERFLGRYFGGASDSGNFYRAIDPPNDPRAGDLTYFGPDPAEYVPYYEKRTNKEANDYTDIVELCRAFDPAQTSDDAFPDLIDSLIDVRQWAKYFAIQTCISNADGSIQTTSGEDYFLYRVPETSGRPDAGRWLLVPWDIEESFASANERLFRSQLPSVRRFLTHPRFAPLYYEALVDLRSGAFSRFETRQRFVLINFLFGFGTIDGIDTYITNRIGFIDSNVPVEISAGALSSISGGDLVQRGELWKYWKGTQAPAGAALAWTQLNYSATGWLEGATGIGYGDGDDTTVLDDMENGYTAIYARRVFNVPDPSTIQSMSLSIDYDDGFVAYLNGVEVARRNAPGAVDSVVPFDQPATATHEAGTPTVIPLDSFLNQLDPGDNILAFQVLNQALDSSDLSFIPELATDLGSSGAIGCGDVLYTTTASIPLSGNANAYLTRSVTVNGQPATYDPFTAVWMATVTGLAVGDNTVLVRAFEGPDGTGSLIQTKALTVRRLTRSPTQVSGTLNGVTSWTEAGGPYLMTGNLTIPVGARLNIGAGTLIIGEANASLIVHGQIQAIGTEEKPILFRALSCTDRWGGIGIDNTGTGAGSPTQTFQFCEFEFGSNAPGYAGCVDPIGSRVLVEHCSFRFLTANAVDGTNARVEVRNSLFEKINEGVHCTSSTVIVTDSTFRGMVGDKDGIDFDLNGAERCAIERNLIEDGSDDGIDLQETAVDIRDNVIRNVADKAMSLEMNGPLGEPTITGNLIYNSGSAIALKSGLTLTECHHNTIVGNQEGLNLFAKAGAADGGHGTFHSLIVWSNIDDVKIDALSTATFSYCDISGGVRPGTGNISSDPSFVNLAEGNFALRSSSPCVGTGFEGTDMGAVPFDGAPRTFIRADSDTSTSINLTDAVFTLTYLFRSGPQPLCLDASDANDDGSVDVADPVFTLLYLYAAGRVPPAPFPAAGSDTTADTLPCN